jgi:TRAP-type uncharacterized transport system substrate-binding protein
MSSIKEDFKEHVEASLELLRDRCLSLLRFFRETWPLLIFLAIIIGMAIWLAKPAPPRRVSIATGAAGGSVQIFAAEYVEFFRRHGITLETVTTGGSCDNISLLLDKKSNVKAAFVQGGILKPEQTKDLLSLGSIAYEPLWFFHRGKVEGAAAIEALKTRKFAIGPPDGGTNVLARHFLRLNGIPLGPNILQIPLAAAADALARGEIDGMLVVDSLDSPLVQKLLRNPVLYISNFNRAKAYEKLLPFIEIVQLPMGLVDVEENLPPDDVQLIATTVGLIVDKDLHPAIQMLFMQAAAEVNGRETFFSGAKEFPSYKDSTVKESEIAQRFYKHGPPLLMRYLPFWLAEFIDRMLVILMPLVAFAYPIISSMPNFRRQRVLKRMQQQYGKLKFLENDITSSYDPARRDEYIQRLDTLERDVISFKVPQNFAENYFQLRSNIDFVRGILNKL